MHNFKIDDEVYYPVDTAPFKVIGIRKSSVEIEGDFSGGIHNVVESDWVNPESIVPYDETKVKYYIEGRAYRNGMLL